MFQAEKLALHLYEYLDNLKFYIPFIANNKNYLVYNGCGSVLEWRNDSIVRIDKSFLHKNQYGAVTFVYKNKIFYSLK